MVVYGYARLVGYDEDYDADAQTSCAPWTTRTTRSSPCICDPATAGRTARPSPRPISDYWWNDVANNEALSPSGPPDFLRIEGELPTVTFPDETTVVFAWENRNPNFLQALAQARPPFIYRPAHYLKQFHEKYADPATLAAAVDDARVKSWAALHNKLDNMYNFDNPDLPTLQPWINASAGKKIRHLFVRNPYYHRIDTAGVQLPYIDVVEMEIVAGGLIAAKANAGEVRPAGPRARFPRHLDPAQGRGRWRQLRHLSLGQRRRVADRDLSQPQLQRRRSGARCCATSTCAGRCRSPSTARRSTRRSISAWPSPAR